MDKKFSLTDAWVTRDPMELTYAQVIDAMQRMNRGLQLAYEEMEKLKYTVEKTGKNLMPYIDYMEDWNLEDESVILPFPSINGAPDQNDIDIYFNPNSYF